MTAPDRPTREQIDAALARADYAVSIVTSETGGGGSIAVLAAEVRALRAELGARPRQCSCPDAEETYAQLEREHERVCAELDASRAALAARTQQPAERPDVIRSVGALRRSGGNVDRWDGRRWVPTVIVAGSTREGPYSEEPAPWPAVPDGEARQADADLDGRPLQPVTEALLVQAGEQLLRAVAPHDHPARQAVADVADWLRGKLGDPGTGWPVRAALAPVSDGEDVPARLEAAAEVLDQHDCDATAQRVRDVAAALRAFPAEVRAAVAAALALPTETQK